VKILISENIFAPNDQKLPSVRGVGSKKIKMIK
jgi:hypothetical protein